MKHRYVAFVLVAGVMLSATPSVRAAEGEGAATPPPAPTVAPPAPAVEPPAPAVVPPAAPTALKPKMEATPAGQGQPSTEGQYSQWLVQVLSLSRYLPAAPSAQECFTLLLQNGITPRNGWNSTSLVTRATLARTVVQALGRQSEIPDPNNDASWIDYLKKIGIEISTLGAALAQLGPLDDAQGNSAVVVSTDPLRKTHRIRPVDEELMGVDISTIRTVLTQIEEVLPPTPGPEPKPPVKRKPRRGESPAPRPPPVTPS